MSDIPEQDPYQRLVIHNLIRDSLRLLNGGEEAEQQGRIRARPVGVFNIFGLEPQDVCPGVLDSARQGGNAPIPCTGMVLVPVILWRGLQR